MMVAVHEKLPETVEETKIEKSDVTMQMKGAWRNGRVHTGCLEIEAHALNKGLTKPACIFVKFKHD